MGNLEVATAAAARLLVLRKSRREYLTDILKLLP